MQSEIRFLTLPVPSMILSWNRRISPLPGIGLGNFCSSSGMKLKKTGYTVKHRWVNISSGLDLICMWMNNSGKGSGRMSSERHLATMWQFILLFRLKEANGGVVCQQGHGYLISVRGFLGLPFLTL